MLLVSDNGTIQLVSHTIEFSTTVSKSYLCAKEQTFVLKYMKNVTNTTDSQMLVSHVQLQAFHTSRDANFGAGMWNSDRYLSVFSLK